MKLIRVLVDVCVVLCLVVVIGIWMQERKCSDKTPTEVQIRIHEGIMDHHAIQDVNPTGDLFEELVGRRKGY